jgi:AcrR family transcriptional regulator
VSLEEIGRRFEVGVATLHRRFPSKEALVRAILEERFAERVQPAIEQALTAAAPWQGLVRVLAATMAVASRERSTLTAARELSTVTGELVTRLRNGLTELMRRAQHAGVARSDLTPDDLPRVVVMLAAVARLGDQPDSEDWRRHLALPPDGCRPAGAIPLPPPAAPLTGGFPHAHRRENANSPGVNR